MFTDVRGPIATNFKSSYNEICFLYSSTKSQRSIYKIGIEFSYSNSGTSPNPSFPWKQSISASSIDFISSFDIGLAADKHNFGILKSGC